MELAKNAGLPEKSNGHDEIVSPWQPSFLSDDRSSLQGVWKLLDNSPGVTPRGNHGNEVSKFQARESSSTADSFTVKIQPSHMQSKPERFKPVLSIIATGKWKPSQVNGKKNYNVRDEDVREGL